MCSSEQPQNGADSERRDGWMDEKIEAVAEAISAALEVRTAANKMNTEYGFVIFEDEDGSALASAVIAVLEQNGWRLMKVI